jgi:osmoprotectant transport system permease protein
VIDWAWIGGHLGDLAFRTLQHLYLTAVSTAAGFAISLGLAVWALRWRIVLGPVIAAAGLLYTIPSLALFPFFVPLTGLTDLTAVIPLTLYSLIIFIRNIVAGFDAVPADILEAADGSGYTRAGRFRRIELPLATPLVVAGIRLAAVSTIGLVTITGVIGDKFGGLGFFILEGRRRNFFATEILVGAVASIVLAIAIDLVLVWLERRLTPWSRTAATSRGAGTPRARLDVLAG